MSNWEIDIKYFPSFKTIVTSEFQKSSHDIGMFDQAWLEKERLLFWNEIHRFRLDDEDKKFSNSVNGKENKERVLYVIGQIGCGKSSFVLSKIESRKTVCGLPKYNFIYFDITKIYSHLDPTLLISQYYSALTTDQTKVDELSQEEILVTEFCKKLDVLFAEQIKVHFLNCFRRKYEYYDGDSFDNSEQLFDYNHPLIPEMKEIKNINKQKGFSNNFSIDCMVAAVCVLINSHYEVNNSIYSQIQKQIVGRTRVESFLIAYNYIKDSVAPEVVQSVISVKDNPTYPRLVTYWLTNYCNFFGSFGESCAKNIVFVDNGDALLDGDRCMRILSEYVKRLQFDLFQKNIIREENFPKIIVALRDDNYWGPTHGRYDEYSPEILSISQLGSDDLQHKLLTQPDFNHVFISDVITARLKKLENHQELIKPEYQGFLEMYFFFCREIWINYLGSMNEKYREQYSRIDLFDLVNESIRLGLDLVNTTTFTMIDGFLAGIIKQYPIGRININQDAAFKYAHGIYKPIIFYEWFFGSKFSENFKSQIKKDYQGVLKGDLMCCPHRVILTYLYKKTIEDKSIPMFPGIKIEVLINDLSTYFGYSIDQIKKMLFLLYRTGEINRDLIIIEQGRRINEYSDISSLDADICLNFRGRAYVRRISHSFQYWSLIHLSIGYQKLLSMDLRGFIEYLTTSLSSLNELAERHRINWIILITDRNRKFIRSRYNYPFDEYKQLFCIGNVFFVERLYMSFLRNIPTLMIKVLSFNRRHKVQELINDSKLFSDWVYSFDYFASSRAQNRKQELEKILKTIKDRESEQFPFNTQEVEHEETEDLLHAISNSLFAFFNNKIFFPFQKELKTNREISFLFEDLQNEFRTMFERKNQISELKKMRLEHLIEIKNKLANPGNEGH
jgi:hypothetical protein